MNVILTRTKDEHLNVWWKPFATSTPLKPKSSSAKIVNVSQKQLLTHSNKSPDFVEKPQRSYRTANVLQKESTESKQSVFKRTRKKKSSTYYDLTSSSDEGSSDGNKKRPIIKLRSGKKFKSILVNKNLSSEEMEKVGANKEVYNCKKLENTSIKNCETNTVHNVGDLKSKNVQSPDNKSRILNDTFKLVSNFKDTSLSSDEGSKIFDEPRKARNMTKDITFCSVNKENNVKNSKNDGSLKHLNMSDNAGKTVLKETFIINPNFTKNIHKNNGHYSESLNISQNRAFKCNKLYKSQKRKGKDDESTNNIVKKTGTKKAKDKLMRPVERNSKNSGSVLHILEYKTNLSHQLFSDSKEQELINILDLTKEEVDEKVKNMEISFIQKKKKLPYKLNNSSHPSINISVNLNKCEQNKPKRRNQNWKKQLTSENPSNELLQNVIVKKKILKPETNSEAKGVNNQLQEFQIEPKSEELNMHFEGGNEENLIKNDRKSLKAQRKSKRKTTRVLQKNKSFIINDLLNKSISNNKLSSFEFNSVLSSVGSNIDNIKIADSNKPLVSENKKTVIRKKPVFKLLSELSYKESEMGCSVAQGWSINNFKCGIFKLKVKSQMTCKTLHSSSNLGGVLIKGNLRMKIGNKELNLTEGDMAFVPPLTEWQATNTGKCETLFYYWCGRFNV